MRQLVSVGGGTAQSHIAPAIARQSDLRTAFVCPTSDDGGSTGRIIDDRGLGPVGDLLDVFCAVGGNVELARVFRHRFAPRNTILGIEVGEFLKGHTVGNIALAALQEQAGGSLYGMCLKAAELLGLPGNVEVLPCADMATRLTYLRKDQRLWEMGEHLLDEVPPTPLPSIEEIKIHLLNGNSREELCILDRVFEVIDDAEIVILGPGDFVGSVLASVMVPGFADALRRAQQRRARVVLGVNLVTKATDSYGFTAERFVTTFERFTGVKVDVVLCNGMPLLPEVTERYSEELAEGVRVDIYNGWEGKQVVAGDFLEIDKDGRARHRPNEFVQELMKLFPQQ